MLKLKYQSIVFKTRWAGCRRGPIRTDTGQVAPAHISLTFLPAPVSVLEPVFLEPLLISIEI